MRSTDRRVRNSALLAGASNSSLPARYRRTVSMFCAKQTTYEIRLALMLVDNYDPSSILDAGSEPPAYWRVQGRREDPGVWFAGSHSL